MENKRTSKAERGKTSTFKQQIVRRAKNTILAH